MALLNQQTTPSLLAWKVNADGDFPMHDAVVKIMPAGTQVLSVESHGTSSWTKTAKISVILPDGRPKKYFLKCAKGEGARPLVEGEYHSAKAIDAIVPGLVPEPAGWGGYVKDATQEYFFLGDFHEMHLLTPPEPLRFISQLAELHKRGKSPNGMFGFHVPTAFGKFERTVTWEKSWAKSFSNVLKDVIKYDNETNGPWPKYDVACNQLIELVIPRLLGALQSDGRDIVPTLIHGDIWKGTSASIWRLVRMYSSTQGPHMPTMRWNLAPGAAPGHFISIHQRTCASTKAKSHPLSQQRSGMIETGCIVSIPI